MCVTIWPRDLKIHIYLLDRVRKWGRRGTKTRTPAALLHPLWSFPSQVGAVDLNLGLRVIHVCSVGCPATWPTSLYSDTFSGPPPSWSTHKQASVKRAVVLGQWGWYSPRQTGALFRNTVMARAESVSLGCSHPHWSLSRAISCLPMHLAGLRNIFYCCSFLVWQLVSLGQLLGVEFLIFRSSFSFLFPTIPDFNTHTHTCALL